MAYENGVLVYGEAKDGRLLSITGELLNVGRQLNDVSQVIAMMLVIMGIGILIDGFVFKKLEDKVMSRWGLR